MKRGALKSTNLKAIGSVVTADAVLCGLLLAQAQPSFESIGSVAAARVLVGPITVVFATFVSSILPANFKAMLVYWRIRDALPGFRAFSHFAVRDDRIDAEALRRNVGAFPIDPKEQNVRWYKLFKKVDSAAEVVDPHGRFLLFRDVAGLSFLSAVLAPVTLYYLGSKGAAIASLAIFGFQYLIAALAARFSGERLVASVLALHSLKKYR